MAASLNSLHDQVADRLRNLIFAGELQPGSWVDEVQWCENWSISRTPLREALKVLSAEGLVRHEPRRGCFVSEVTEQDRDDIFPVIAMLESRCAHEAASHANQSDIQAMALLHDQLQVQAKAGQIQDYDATNHLIHDAIIAMAGNKWLATVIGDLRKILKLAGLQKINVPGRLTQSLKEHMAIFAAIQARDPQAAGHAMHVHLSRQHRALHSMRQTQNANLPLGRAAVLNRTLSAKTLAL